MDVHEQQSASAASGERVPSLGELRAIAESLDKMSRRQARIETQRLLYYLIRGLQRGGGAAWPTPG